MFALGPKEAESYLSFSYFLKYAAGVEVPIPVLYGPPRIGKSEVVKRSFVTFVRAVAKDIVEKDFLGLFEEGSKELKERHASLSNVIATGNKQLIAEALEEVDEETMFIATSFSLADKCDNDPSCSNLHRIISTINSKKVNEFYEKVVLTRAFVPTKDGLKAWEEGVMYYKDQLNVDEYDNKFVYVELHASELSEEDLEGMNVIKENFFTKVPPKWASALSVSLAGLLHIENATVLPWNALSKLLDVLITKRIGMCEFGKLSVLSGPDPSYAEVTLIPSYVSSGNLEYVRVRAPTVREWKEQLDDEGEEWAEEVYYFLQVTSPNHGEGVKYEELRGVVEEVSKRVKSYDTFLPPPEVVKEFENRFTPYPTPKAWKALAKALAVSKAEVAPLAFSYLGDESVAELFVEFVGNYAEALSAPEKLKELASSKDLAARVALAALTFRALEGDEEVKKLLEEAGIEVSSK
ncbi:hypothetical protein [Ignicoccus hospitalis]|uniref:Uncharacterized protein n=1 Tax=Ignicoccus hospitalis (strain KIN4/I / DSM 18386 / JCM 14125) TaxID=453591 RepID=A8A950_IGNH4|nr:hypothetical protein [Ignicoccus hospitalis]ABU81452.1 hypothetical protein Igni_0268 [Ignicoccus hospitalis KIN4/I]HIH90242.1 hypothetical protein [Desulfurococcaceae archaeon]